MQNSQARPQLDEIPGHWVRQQVLLPSVTSSTTGSGNTAVRDKLYGQRQFAASANGRVVSIPLWHMPTGEGLLPGWEYCTTGTGTGTGTGPVPVLS